MNRATCGKIAGVVGAERAVWRSRVAGIGCVAGLVLFAAGIAVAVAGIRQTDAFARCSSNCGDPPIPLILAGVSAVFIGMAVAIVVPVLALTSFTEPGDRIRLREKGLAGTARILRIEDNGGALNDDPIVELDLSVELPGREPYLVHHKSVVPRLRVGLVTDGRVVGVVVDPADPARLVVNWEEPAAQPAGL